MKKCILLFFFILFLVSALFSEVFRFKYKKGEKYHIIATINEHVFFNNNYINQANMLYRIAVEVAETKDRSGKLLGHFQISHHQNSSYQYMEEHFSSFWRDEKGNYTIDPSFYYPVARNIPIFPNIDIKPGFLWSARGDEAHDFAKNYNIHGVFHFPFDVNYEYVGKVERDGKILDKIKINYTVFYEIPSVPGATGVRILRIIGKSTQEYFWDNSAGRPYYYTEVFDFIHFMSTGDMWEYRGTGEAQVIEAEYLDKDKVVEDIKKQIEEEGIKDATVKAVPEGISLVLEDVQFSPDSSLLLTSEIEKLKKIASILNKYPERDILLVGHTARIGTEESCQILSEKRAIVVGNFLLNRGVRKKTEITVRGKGSTEPIADNSTSKGRSRNRRVEIIILEN